MRGSICRETGGVANKPTSEIWLISIFVAYLKYGNSCPKDVIKMLPVALALWMVTYNFWARAITFVAHVVDVLAKLTTKQIHPQNTARPRVDVK